jgi:hypothetical protein
MAFLYGINEQEREIIAPLGAMTLKNVSVTTPIHSYLLFFT